MPREPLNLCTSILIIIFFPLMKFVASDRSISHPHSPSPSPSHMSLPPSLSHAVAASPGGSKMRPPAAPSSSRLDPGQTDANKENYNLDQALAASPTPAFPDLVADIDDENSPLFIFSPDLGYSPALAPWIGEAELIFSPIDSPSYFGDYGAVDFGEEEGSSSRSRVGGTVVGALVVVGLVGLGGFVYHKRKKATSNIVTRGQYQSVDRNVV